MSHPSGPLGPAGGDADLRAQVARLEALVTEQRESLTFLRKRTGWVLLWAFLAMLGSCGAQSVDVDPLRNDVQQLQHTVDQVQQDVGTLRTDLESGDLKRPSPTPARTGG